MSLFLSFPSRKCNQETGEIYKYMYIYMYINMYMYTLYMYVMEVL